MGNIEKAMKELKTKFNAKPTAAIFLWSNKKGESGTCVVVNSLQERLMLIEAAETEKLFIQQLRKHKANEYYKSEIGEDHPVYNIVKKGDVGVG